MLFPPRVVAEVKALARELPAKLDLPLSRFSRSELRRYVASRRADVMMPQMHGYEPRRRLTQDPQTAGIPVVLLTARKRLDEAQIESPLAAGVLFQPFEPDELAARIRQLCRGTDG